jgi:sugar/nucleoside kinase (ribokinase family)
MVNLVIIGHVGINDECSPYGEVRTLGGAGYGCARGASVLGPERIGLVSVVGAELGSEALGELGVDMRGVRIMDGPSAHFRIVQSASGERFPDVNLGLAKKVFLDCFPREYESAEHVHVCTAPPDQQLDWLQFLRKLPGSRTISCDAFEHYAQLDPSRSRAALINCDLRFLNDVEHRLLFADDTLPLPAITKHGAGGASFLENGRAWRANTDSVTAVDTTHAGEILAGVFLALRLAAVEPATALSNAVRAATAKVTQFGVDGDRLLSTLAKIRSEVSTHSNRT